MPYKIKNVSLQGIRGFNKQEEVSFGEGVTLLYGQNGSGKSSLLQSIEWGFTGNITNMKGGDFTREDAIVNLFNKSKKAEVEINLSDEKTGITLKRTRKMGTKTAFGKQPLELKFEDKTLKDEEAETELEKVLSFSSEAFPRSKYLHQETIREILQAKPEDRSQAIDKLLGTYEVREFAKTIDIEKQTKSSVRALRDTADALKRDKIQFHLNLKRNVEKTKEALVAKGYAENELTLPAAMSKIDQTRIDVNALKDKYGTNIHGSLKIDSEAQSLIDAQRTLLNQLNDLDRTRLENINRINSHKNNLKSDSTRYYEVYAQFQGMKQTDASSLSRRINEIDDELAKNRDKTKDVRQKLTSLPHTQSIYETNKKKLEAEINKLGELRKKFGAIEEIQQRIKSGDDELKSIDNNLEKLSGQQRLISLAIDHLEATKTQECPVCFRNIDNEQLTKELKTKISDEITQSIKRLRDSEKNIKSERRTLDDAIDENKLLSQNIVGFEKSLAAAAADLGKLVPNFEGVNLEEISKGWEKEIQECSELESKLREEQNGFKDLLNRLTHLQAELEKLQTSLQKETLSAFEGPELLEKVSELAKRLDEEIGRYSDSSKVDELREKLAGASDVLNYLRDEEQVIAAEKELPLVERQISEIESRAGKLEGLSNSLLSIRQIAINYQKEASIAQLRRLEDALNTFYSKIEGHPYFKRLKIDIEKEDPLIFSIRAASTQEDTYIPTRFSTAQLNAVALSIFMSYSCQEAGNLPIMILDDPTQNMDYSHKEAFAKLIATLPPRHQIIVATEDNDTRKLMEKHCIGIKTYELGNWTPEETKIKLD